MILCAGELCLPYASLVFGQEKLHPSHMIMSRAAGRDRQAEEANHRDRLGQQAMTDWGKILEPGFWGTFRIPAFAFGVAALLLLFRNVSEGVEFIYIQRVATYALGASVISFGHYQCYSTWTKRRAPDRDLPFWGIGLAIASHLLWFGYYFLLRVAP